MEDLNFVFWFGLGTIFGFAIGINVGLNILARILRKINAELEEIL